MDVEMPEIKELKHDGMFVSWKTYDGRPMIEPIQDERDHYLAFVKNMTGVLDVKTLEGFGHAHKIDGMGTTRWDVSNAPDHRDAVAAQAMVGIKALIQEGKDPIKVGEDTTWRFSPENMRVISQETRRIMIALENNGSFSRSNPGLPDYVSKDVYQKLVRLVERTDGTQLGEETKRATEDFSRTGNRKRLNDAMQDIGDKALANRARSRGLTAQAGALSAVPERTVAKGLVAAPVMETQKRGMER